MQPHEFVFRNTKLCERCGVDFDLELLVDNLLSKLVRLPDGSYLIPASHWLELQDVARILGKEGRLVSSAQC